MYYIKTNTHNMKLITSLVFSCLSISLFFSCKLEKKDTEKAPAMPDMSGMEILAKLKSKMARKFSKHCDTHLQRYKKHFRTSKHKRKFSL